MNEDVGMKCIGVLDKEELRRRFAGREALLQQVVEIACRTFPEMLEKIRREMSEGDLAAVRRDGHTFEGQLKTFYALAATERLKQLRSAVAIGDGGEARVLLSLLEEDVRRLRDHLRNLSAQLEVRT